MHRFHHHQGQHGHGEEGCECGGHGSHGGHGFGKPHHGGGHGHGGPFGRGKGIAQNMHAMMAAHSGMRARRGDVRPAVLRLLAEQPMHGYQIIQELTSRSGGAWTPSAGSVYPTLQLLADEGLIIAEESGSKKVFSLTEAGVAAAAEVAEQAAPWENAAQLNADASGYREAAGKLMHAAFLIGRDGSPVKREAAIEVLNDARKKLFDLLAQD